MSSESSKLAYTPRFLVFSSPLLTNALFACHSRQVEYDANVTVSLELWGV